MGGSRIAPRGRVKSSAQQSIDIAPCLGLSQGGGSACIQCDDVVQVAPFEALELSLSDLWADIDEPPAPEWGPAIPRTGPIKRFSARSPAR